MRLEDPSLSNRTTLLSKGPYLWIVLLLLFKCGDGVEVTPVDSDGDGFSIQDGDCDDNDPSVYPGAEEVCDNIDNDCDNYIDEDGCNEDFDADGDGWTEGDGDCDDTNENIYPGADETPYDGIDDDCDGSDLTDVDGDGYDYADAGGSDCDDNDPLIYPGAEEVCDGADNDCDGDIDEGCGQDSDGDGFPSANDCNDLDPAIYPGADETPYDGIDDDCDGSDLTDVDGDGYDSLVVGGDDCDDEDRAINPGADDERDGIDNNCDGIIDPLEFFDSCDTSQPNLWGGYWWTFTDSGSGGTSTITISTSHDNHVGDISGCSLEITGVVTDETWYGEGYIGVGADLNEDSTAEDLTSYSSITFSAKGDGGTYRISVMSADVTDYDYHGAEWTSTTSWQTYTINFSDLEQAGWGDEVPFSADRIIGIEIMTTEYPVSSVHFYIDGLYFE